MKEELMEEGIGEMGRKSQEKVKVQLLFYLLERGQPLSLLARVPQSAFSGISGSPTRASNAAEQAGKSGMHPSTGTCPLVSLTLPTGNGSICLVRVSSRQHGLILPTRGHSGTSGDIFCHNRRLRVNSSPGI